MSLLVHDTSAVSRMRTAVALGAVHADPAHPWTVAELADVAALSRAVSAP